MENYNPVQNSEINQTENMQTQGTTFTNASFGKRAIAYIIDAIILGVIVNVLILLPLAGDFTKIVDLTARREALIGKYDKIEKDANSMADKNPESMTEEEAMRAMTDASTMMSDLNASLPADTAAAEKIDKESQEVASGLVIKTLIFVLIALIAVFAYIGILESRGGTVGKKVMKIKVVGADNNNVSILIAILRKVVLGVVPFEPIISFALILTRPDKKALHDIIFKTSVVDVE